MLAQVDVETVTVNVPINGVLVELTELPVHGVDVHVVVLLKVVGQEVQGVLTSLQPLLVLIDLLDLQKQTHSQQVQF